MIGLFVIRLGDVPLTAWRWRWCFTVRSSIGWIRSRNQVHGNMPLAASQLLKDLGLAGFVAAVAYNQVTGHSNH